MPNSLTAVLCNHIVDSINPTSSNRRLAFPVVTSPAPSLSHRRGF